jgi:glucokinase
MILAGDVGGTKTILGLFNPREARPTPIVVREFPTPSYSDLGEVLAAFAQEPAVHGALVESACFGVAGPILGDTATLTNVAFTIDAPAIARAFEIPRVTLLNDLEAMAHAVPWLGGDELHVLQEGRRDRHGNIALIAAGTGLGQALLHNIGGRLVPSPTEAGHADWAARNERDMGILRGLIDRYGRAEVEQVISGRGLVNLHRLTHRAPCAVVDDDEDPGAAAAISKAALERTCGGCVEALDIFVGAYGAEAGNLALRSVATGGVFVGGGIAPKILPALIDGRFVRAFQDKAPFRDMLANMPIQVILNPNAGLVGASIIAAARR